MRVSAIFGPGASEKDLQTFKKGELIWTTGIPAKKDDVDAVLLLGGDGTIHRYLPQLLELQVPLLVIPQGSGNDFARALNLHSPMKSMAAWEKFILGAGNIRWVDIGTIKAGSNDTVAREHFFCTVAGVGIDGEVARRANRLPRWLRGNGGYVFTLLPTIFQFAPVPMKIILDGNVDSSVSGFRPNVLAAFANASTFGGGMKIAPKARLDDGRLDVCVIGGIDKFKLFCVFPTVYFGKHLGISEVEYSQAESIRIETEHPFDVYADGEFVCQTPVEVSIRRSALPVIVPA